jgi:hypothetical protein
MYGAGERMVEGELLSINTNNLKLLGELFIVKIFSSAIEGAGLLPL